MAINFHITCGGCEHCIRGDLRFCDTLTAAGFDMDGGFAEYALIPGACCMMLPDDISFEVGSLMVDVLGTAYRGVKRAGLFPRDRVAVWGAGPVGLSASTVASWLGAEVAVLDMNPYRRSMVRALGASLILDPAWDDVGTDLMDWTGGRGLDVAFECVGSEKAAQQALPMIRKRGKLAYIGVAEYSSVNPWEDLIQRELTIYGSRCYVVPEFDEMVAMVRKGLPVDKIVTHRFAFAEVEAAFDLFLSARCGKVVIES